MGFLLWPFLTAAIFLGICSVIITISACILIGANRLTLPRSNERRIETAKADAEIAKLRFEKEQAESWREDLITSRMQAAEERKGLPRGEDL